MDDWNLPVKELYEKLVENPPDTPRYQKLALLVQLKAGQAGENAATAVAGYTKWLAAFTVVIAVGTVVQAVFAALMYFLPPAH
jgi:CRISPR/Cas system-associated exonuclease Cas4 (RecB family)